MNFVENLQNDFLPFLAEEAPTASLLKRIFLFLEDGEFIQADSYCEKVLDTEPENPLAYLCKLMASRRISSVKDLATSQYIIDNDSSYIKAVRFANEEMQLHLHQLNMHIYTNSIDACRNRAKIHMAHGELKETAQQYHDAVKMWENCHKTLPNADAIYMVLSNEVADFNWKLLLHNRQCPDDTQLIASSIPIDNDRWYISAIKWADSEKKSYFKSVAKDILWGAHIKCVEYIKSKQTRLAQLWANHYRNAAPNDPLSGILQALVDTDGYTKFVEAAPDAMLKLIKLYKDIHPQRAEEMKDILQGYYLNIFQSLLDFTGTETQVTSASFRLSADDYALLITQQEANACSQKAADSSTQQNIPAETTVTDPVWATETARKISALMANAFTEELSPYGIVSIFLIAAKELTIRYGKKDGIVTKPTLFRFICGYYADAIKQAQAGQISAIQAKFNDFLIDTVRLSSASFEIVTEASGYMQGSNLPYQIYLARITNNYSVKAEELIPPQITECVESWQQNLENADPKRDCYWINDQQEAITLAFASAESTIQNCRQHTNMLQNNLSSPYQQVLDSAGESREELSSDWELKMQALENHCNECANALEGTLNQVKELNSAKLALAQKQIKTKEVWQLILSIGMNTLLLFTILAFANILVSSITNAWNLLDAGHSQPNRTAFYAINVLAPLIAGILSLTNGIASSSYNNKGRSKLLWMYSIFSIVTYIFVFPDFNTFIFDTASSGIAERTSLKAVAILAIIAVTRTLLEFLLCKLCSYTRDPNTKISCRIGSNIAKIAGLAQALACLAIVALYVCCLMLTL